MPKYYNTAPNFDFDFEDEEPNIAPPKPRANVPPYRVAGDDPNNLPVLVPPRPLPPSPNRQFTGATLPPRQTAGVNLPPTTRPQPRATAPVLTPRPAVQGRPKARFAVNPGWLSQGKLKLGLLIVGLGLAALLAYTLISSGVKAWQTWQDDMTYGRPRTVQVSRFVGHDEADGVPSHFIVQNNNRQVTVVEYPGGDASKTRVFQGPRLFGKDAELIPVKIRFEDINGDNHVDMVLIADDQLIVYINQNSNFRPLNSDEQIKFKSKIESIR